MAGSKRKKMARAGKKTAEPEKMRKKMSESEEMMAGPEKIPFGRGVSNLLDKMNGISHCDKEVFLWELVRNSAGALYHFRRATLYDTNIEMRLFIDIFLDKNNKTLFIVDNGIGMTEDVLKNTLFTILKPSLEVYKKTVVKLLKNEIKVDEFYSRDLDAPRLGFLAAYMVADSIEITTKHHEGDSECRLFSSTSERSFHIVEDRSGTVSSPRGTKVTLHLNRDHFEYLDECRLKGLIDKYTFDLCPYPVSIHVLNPCTNIIQRSADLKVIDMKLMKRKFEGLRRLFKEDLGLQVKNVVVSDHMYDLPCFLSLDKETLEINPRSPVVEKLRQDAERNPKDKEVLGMISLQFQAAKACMYLYDWKHGTHYAETQPKVLYQPGKPLGGKVKARC